MARHPFAAVNLISDPVHGYVELTKRLSPEDSLAAELPAEDVAETVTTSASEAVAGARREIVCAALVITRAAEAWPT
mgnify:CR=1 FL=1